jgi:hypothetical protein
MSPARSGDSYRVIYNQDCTALFLCAREPILPEHVDRMVDEVADGGADVMLINPNAQKANYPSRVWETYWDGDASERAPFAAQMKRLADGGCDYLARSLARCRKRGITPGVSVRMNDMHGSEQPDTDPQNSRFYRQHPEYRLSGRGGGRLGLSYEHAAVRDHYLKLIGELIERYEFRVLELDFLRFQAYFPRGQFGERCAIMTDFIRQVRAMTLSASRKIDLLGRVASTPAAAYELGFDLAAWGREKLVDGVIFSEFLNTGWEMPVDEFRAQVGDAVALYAGADVSADRRPGLPVRYMPLNARLMRGFAAAYLAAGANGLYFFNYYSFPDSQYRLLGEVASREQLRGTAKTFLITSTGRSHWETDLPHQVPTVLGATDSREFDMQLAGEPEGTAMTLQVVFSGGASADQLWLRFNQVPVGSAQPMEPGSPRQSTRILNTSAKISLPACSLPLETAEFSLPDGAVRDGFNRLTLRNEGKEINIHGLEVHVL